MEQFGASFPALAEREQNSAQGRGGERHAAHAQPCAVAGEHYTCTTTPGVVKKRTPVTNADTLLASANTISFRGWLDLQLRCEAVLAGGKI